MWTGLCDLEISMVTDGNHLRNRERIDNAMSKVFSKVRGLGGILIHFQDSKAEGVL